MPELRRLAVAVALLAAVGGTAAGAQRLLGRPPALPPPPVPTGTAPVLRTDLAARQDVDGVLGYAQPRTVSTVAAGVLTALPPPAAVLGRGTRLYEVDGRPVWLLYGRRPAWRGFGPGMPDGPDVRQLEQNLVALGAGPELPVDDHFGRATAAAVRRWQRASGVPATGSVPAGVIAFLPGRVRVAAVDAAVGAVLQAGAPVLDVSTTRQVVTSTVDLATAAVVRRGDPARVSLPGGAEVAGTVAVLTPVVPDRTAGRAASGAGGSGTGGDSSPAAAGMTVTVVLAGRAPTGALGAGGSPDGSPVRVAITTGVRRRVLVVPVTALLARRGGGYEVAVVGAGGRRRVAVTVGLFDDTAGVVEVAGPALVPGTQVEVPAG